jgi:hypothetical protein
VSDNERLAAELKALKVTAKDYQTIQISLEESLQIAQTVLTRSGSFPSPPPHVSSSPYASPLLLMPYSHPSRTQEIKGEQRMNVALRSKAQALEGQLLSQATSKGEQAVATDLEAQLELSHTELTDVNTQYRACLMQLKNAHEQIKLLHQLQATMDREKDEREKRGIWDVKQRTLAASEREVREKAADAERQTREQERLMHEQVVDSDRLGREKGVEEAHNQRIQEQSLLHQQALREMQQERQQEVREARKRALEREEEFRGQEERADSEIRELRKTLQESRQREREQWETLRHKADKEEKDAWEQQEAEDVQKRVREEEKELERVERARLQREKLERDRAELEAELRQPGPAAQVAASTHIATSSPSNMAPPSTPVPRPSATSIVTPPSKLPSPNRRASFGFKPTITPLFSKSPPSSSKSPSPTAPGPAGFAAAPGPAPGPFLPPTPVARRTRAAAAIAKPSSTRRMSGIKPPSSLQSLR